MTPRATTHGVVAYATSARPDPCPSRQTQQMIRLLNRSPANPPINCPVICAPVISDTMPAAAATRESIARMVGHGLDNVDFAILLEETAKDSGLAIKPLNLQIGDGLTS